MFRLLDKHQGFIRSVLWPVSLISAALFVPFVLAKTLPSRSGVTTSAGKSSPSSQLSFLQTPEKLLAEREWQHNLVSQGLSYKPRPESTTNKTATKSSTTKTQTSKTQATAAKTETTQLKSSVTKTNNSQPSKPKKQTPASAPPKTSKTQNSNKAPAQPPQPSKNAPVLELRVAVANGESSLVVGSSTSAEIVNSQGKILGKIAANEGTNVQPDGQYLRIGKWQTPAGVWLKPAKGGFVFVNNNWYRGDILLVSQGNSLLAVNYIDLESYIASVVGAEVSPSWPIDALKAQAIAARSYALVHYIRPAHDLYDLGNT
ncbi:MAG: SpoIID/LytB domain-containing protein [Potamolinea sp.]